MHALRWVYENRKAHQPLFSSRRSTAVEQKSILLARSSDFSCVGRSLSGSSTMQLFTFLLYSMVLACTALAGKRTFIDWGIQHCTFVLDKAISLRSVLVCCFRRLPAMQGSLPWSSSSLCTSEVPYIFSADLLVLVKQKQKTQKRLSA